jgi:hypothetical protein
MLLLVFSSDHLPLTEANGGHLELHPSLEFSPTILNRFRKTDIHSTLMGFLHPSAYLPVD